MDKKQLKQRIVGAIVLIGLGVIFIPMILNRGDESSPITGSNIPPKPVDLARMPGQVAPSKPDVPVVNRDLPQLVDEHTPPVTQIDASVDTNASEQKQQQATAITTKPAESATPDVKVTVPSKPKTSKSETQTTNKSRAWVVQVGSFSEQKKAIKLRDRLRKAKHPTFVESVNGKSGRHYRVRVGPLVKRSKAETLKKKIAKQFNLKDALVMAHP